MLIERGQFVAALGDLLAEATNGSGRLVFLGGEAGVGKTTLAASFVAAMPPDITVRRGACDNVTTADPLGPLFEAIPEIADALVDDSAVPRLRLFRRIREILTESPTVLLLEDVHWADEATLELLRFLGRRIDHKPLLIVATFRADEVGPDHRLTVVLGDLATSPAVSHLALPPLSVEGVRQLVEEAGSSVDPVKLHRRTAGNPFYVTEVLASASGDVPPTVRDAVLARTSRLSKEARTVLSAVAVLGHRAELDLVVVVSGEPVGALDECLRSGVLELDADSVTFRHQLARLAVQLTTSRAASIALHARALAELQRRGSHDDRRLAYHGAGCGNRAVVVEHAPLAAARAARLGAHREAAEQYRVALRWIDEGDDRRASFLERLSYECYLIDELEEALACRQELLELHQRTGDARATGDTERWMSRLSWFLGRNTESEMYAARALDILRPLGDSRELAWAYSNMSQLRMLASDTQAAIEWGNRALELADQLGEREVKMHALNNLGTALADTDDLLLGRSRIQQSLDLALADDAEEHAARAYTNLGSSAVTARTFADADSILHAGIAYCTDRDLDSWRQYMTTWLARSAVDQGRLTEAEQHAGRVIHSPRVSAVTMIPALVVAGQMATWRGDDGSAELDRALALATRTGEAQRLVPVACARAEAAWIAGRTSDIATEIDPAWDSATRHPHAWDLGELAWWLHVAGVPATLPVPASKPFALMLEDDHMAAALEWRSLGCPVWAARALMFSDDVDDAREAVRILDDVGAVAVRDALLRDRHMRGQAVPRGPRSATHANPAGLTTRETQVLALLAEGLSNAEIARELFLSEKTVGHHVSAVLRKLEEPTRSHAVATARRRGMLAN